MFTSKQSQNRAASTVSKLTSSLLHVVPGEARDFNSAAENFHHASNISASAKKIKKNKRKVNQKIEQDKKHQKYIKYQIIKLKDRASLTPEHQKFLRKLAAKNKRLLNLEEDLELDELQNDVLSFRPQSGHKQRKQDKKKFHEGLTPGLAPVDYESDDE